MADSITMRRSNTRRTAPHLLTVGALCLLALLSFFPTSASANLQEAQQLLQQGQPARALERVDKLLATNPKDRSGRFLRGVILAEMNRLDEAVGVFTALTQEAPELPEPYNNLAVIYAQQKQYDKAKAALEMSIRTHPTYAIAHENLGDLYTQMARQAYDRALQIDAGNSAAQSKLKLLREITTAGTRVASKPAPASAAVVASVVPQSEPPKPTAPVAPLPKTTASQSAPTPAKPAVAPTTASAPSVAPAAGKPATATASEPATKPNADAARKEQEAQVRETVQAWAAAWSRKDVKSYLSFYAKDFDVPGGGSRSAWENERRVRVGKPGAIKVSILDLRVDLKGDRATARFRQAYSSANLDSTSGKTLVLVERNGRWQIQQEKIGR